ncbi:MAG: hypothetical protein NZ520_09780, partial [bacterium]|nr:hypothetical protein [bacterium]
WQQPRPSQQLEGEPPGEPKIAPPPPARGEESAFPPCSREATEGKQSPAPCCLKPARQTVAFVLRTSVRPSQAEACTTN